MDKMADNNRCDFHWIERQTGTHAGMHQWSDEETEKGKKESRESETNVQVFKRSLVEHKTYSGFSILG